MTDKPFILVNITIKDAETGSIYQTTKEEVAKESGSYSEKSIYLPILVIPGEADLFPKVMEKILELNEGEKFELKLNPEDAYGNYDRGKVRVYSIKRLEREGIRPRVGETVQIDRQTGIIQSVTGGRVTVDFNHPLAGKKILIEGEIVKRIEDELEKVRSIVADSFDVPLEDIRVEQNEEGVVTVELPSKAYVLRDAYSRKIRSLSLIMRHIKDIRKVIFLEEFEIPKKEEEKKGGSEETSGNNKLGQ